MRLFALGGMGVCVSFATFGVFASWTLWHRQAEPPIEPCIVIKNFDSKSHPSPRQLETAEITRNTSISNHIFPHLIRLLGQSNSNVEIIDTVSAISFVLNSTLYGHIRTGAIVRGINAAVWLFATASTRTTAASKRKAATAEASSAAAFTACIVLC